MSEEQRQEIVEYVFGDDGLKPSLVKLFLDCHHQEEPASIDESIESAELNMELYDHEKTSQWMRYFIREGLQRTKARGDDLDMIVTLYGPPAWMTKQKVVRGCDLDPRYKIECAKYLISWAKFLREKEGFAVSSVSLHNEGEDYRRWDDAGFTRESEPGHDDNLYWPPAMVAEFLPLVRKLLDKFDMSDVATAPGETSNWTRFYDWGYADAIVQDQEALQALGLITSHGFYNGMYGRWLGDHRSVGIDILREQRPELHAWVTSSSWKNMDAKFVMEMRGNIYSAKVNGIIPWACIQLVGGWVGGDPNPGCAFSVDGEGNYSVRPGYYYYKQVSRAGQRGMAVAQANSADTEVAIIAFASNGTKHPDAFVIINIAEESKEIELCCLGSEAKSFQAFRTSPQENYSEIGSVSLSEKFLAYAAPPDSVTTFFAEI